MYSTQIEEIVKIVGIIKLFHDKADLTKGFTKECVEEAIKIVEKVQVKNPDSKIRKERSFFSKYFHWYNEVNNFPALPIYDTNVRKHSKYLAKDYPSLLKQIDCFISYLELKNGDKRVDVKIGEGNKIPYELTTTISIYRLVDKFLWLFYKIKIEQVKIEQGNSKNKELQKVVEAWNRLKG